MLQKTDAIVIHKVKYGDNDLIITLFTKEAGLKTYLQRGVLKSKKGKIKASFFLPLNLLEIEAYHKDRGTLERLKEVKTKVVYQTLHTDMRKSAIVFFIAEILRSSIREEEANQELFDFVEVALNYMDSTERIANFHIYFLIRLSQYLGFYPDVSSIKNPYFDLMEAKFIVQNKLPTTLDKEESSLLKQFLGTTFDANINTQLSKIARKTMLLILIRYFELHLHGFKKPKSLEILQEIFK